MSLQRLMNRHSLAEKLSFREHASGLIMGIVDTDLCYGEFFLHGAHVARFQPRNCPAPVLFMSDSSHFASDKAIRGGIPICFPWFGSHPTAPEKPAHGIARISEWELSSTQLDGEIVQIDLTLDILGFRLAYKVRFGTTLECDLNTTNISPDSLTYEIALHTYLHITNIHDIAIHGLEQSPFLDQLTQRFEPASGSEIRFTRETDRIYDTSPESNGILPPEAKTTSISITEDSVDREIRIRSCGSNSTIVWNPWIDKSKRMLDFGDEEYVRMCCVETANVRNHKIILEPGQSQRIHLEIASLS